MYKVHVSEHLSTDWEYARLRISETLHFLFFFSFREVGTMVHSEVL
jgi:hypothetical protein